jgi:hypothetical protein
MWASLPCFRFFAMLQLLTRGSRPMMLPNYTHEMMMLLRAIQPLTCVRIPSAIISCPSRACEAGFAGLWRGPFWPPWLVGRASAPSSLWSHWGPGFSPGLLVAQGQLYPPVDELVREYVAMPSVLDPEYLDGWRPLLSPNAPDSIPNHCGLQD